MYPQLDQDVRHSERQIPKKKMGKIPQKKMSNLADAPSLVHPVQFAQ
jgi:hypothetical protein